MSDLKKLLVGCGCFLLIAACVLVTVGGLGGAWFFRDNIKGVLAAKPSVPQVVEAEATAPVLEATATSTRTPTATATPTNTPTPTATPVSATATPAPATVEAMIPTATVASAFPVSTTAVTTSTVKLVYLAKDVTYPGLVDPDYNRQKVFPDVAYGNRPALVAYESPFEDGDYFQAGKGDVDLPQFYYRVMTAGTIKIKQLDIDCVSTTSKGCLTILINHFGDTAMWRDATVDNGFTIAGRVWDMGSPINVTLAGQALLDHFIGRMTVEEDGANCGKVMACETVEWHVVVVGNGEVQVHWTGLFRR